MVQMKWKDYPLFLCVKQTERNIKLAHIPRLSTTPTYFINTHLLKKKMVKINIGQVDPQN